MRYQIRWDDEVLWAWDSNEETRAYVRSFLRVLRDGTFDRANGEILIAPALFDELATLWLPVGRQLLLPIATPQGVRTLVVVPRAMMPMNIAAWHTRRNGEINLMMTTLTAV